MCLRLHESGSHCWGSKILRDQSVAAVCCWCSQMSANQRECVSSCWNKLRPALSYCSFWENRVSTLGNGSALDWAVWSCPFGQVKVLREPSKEEQFNNKHLKHFTCIQGWALNSYWLHSGHTKMLFTQFVDIIDPDSTCDLGLESLSQNYLGPYFSSL